MLSRSNNFARCIWDLNMVTHFLLLFSPTFLRRFQELLEVDLMVIMVVVQSIYVCQTIQNTTGIATLGRELAPYMEPSMKLVHSILSRQVTSMTMMYHALCVTSSHVVHNWWCLQGMTVHLGGSKSTMGIWWQHIMTTLALETSFVLTERRSTFMVRRQIRTMHCCILCKEVAAPCHAFRTSPVENWHVLSVQNKER